MSQGAWVLVVAVVAAAGFGLLRAVRDGRFRGTRELAPREDLAGPAVTPASEVPSVLSHAVGGLADSRLGDRATLLQFSSAFCAPCRTTRRVLGEVADIVPGVVHLEVDAEQQLELVRRLDILRTPTTLILDAAGQEISRATGAPRKDAVLATLGRVVQA